MSIEDWLSVLQRESEERSYILRFEILDWSQSLLKVRLFITADLFIQVYRNERFETSNLALIHNEKRIYARDQLGGLWHRHPVDKPDQHETSEEGRRTVTIGQFLDEVESILAMLNLP
jgi:hypothetical protein